MSLNKSIFFSITFISLFVISPIASLADPLIVTTQEVTNINERSATANGHIANDPDFWWTTREVDEFGIYWNTTGVLNTGTDQRSNRGDADLPLEFSIEMKDLQPGMTYYVWAYADPPFFRPVYSNRISFTTLQQPEVTTQPVTDIGSATATGNGTISVLGIPAPIQHGVCWDTKKNPTIDDEKTEEGVPNAIGPFTSKITGLKFDEKYYVRAYATNATGTVYGKQVSFETAAGFPVVTTQAVTDITEKSAMAHATLVDMGEPKAVQHGVCWSTESMPAYSAESCIDKGDAGEEGPFEATISGLTSGTTYYLRAFASNEADVYHYSEEVTFVTPELPTVTTQPASDINTNKAIANGTIIGLGSSILTGHGACWNTAGLPTIADECIDLGPVEAAGPFTALMAELLSGTTYFVRTFATTETVTVYGEERSFRTIDEATAPRATVMNLPYSLTRQTAYQLKVGGSRVVAYQYSLDDGPWSEPMGTDRLLSFDVTEEGPHWLRLLGKDENDVWQARPSATVVTWTLDTTPPKVELPNAPKGTIGFFPAGILVQGNDVIAYRYTLNDGPWSTIYAASVPITLPKLQDGPYTLAVIGTDPAGNWQDDDITIIKWNVDTRVPTALLTNFPDTVTNQTAISIGVVTPEGGIAVEEYYYTFADSGRWFHGDALEPIVVSGLSEGEYSLCVNAGNGLGVWQDGSDGTSSMDSATCYTWRIDLTPTDPAQLLAEEAPPVYIHDGPVVAYRAVKLSWAWQSDDEQEAILRYRIWHAENEITETNLHEAVELFCEHRPGTQGHIESFVVRDLAVNQTHYFAVKTIDQAGNSSALSNVVSITLADTVPEIFNMAFKEGGYQADNTSAATLSLTGKNFINADGGNFIRFENSDAGFLLAGTVEVEGYLVVQIPLGMPTDIYWIRVVNANGISAPGPELITIVDAANPLPAVRNIFPRIAPMGTPFNLTIRGDHFDASAGVVLVAMNGQIYHPVDVVVQDTQTIAATVNVPPDFPEGSYHIRVTNAETQYNQVSTARLELYISQILDDISGGLETDKIVQLEDGVVPVVTTLKTRDQLITGTNGNHRLRMKVFMLPGMTFEVQQPGQSDASLYHGHLLPPRENETSTNVIVKLGEEAVHLSMGADVTLRLKNGAVMFANLEITLPSHLPAPGVYYLATDGGIELAGVQGTWQGIDIEQGGTILSTRPDTPEAGQTTFSIGLLLDHFSEYAVGSSTNNGFSDLFQSDDAYGPCFINAVR